MAVVARVRMHADEAATDAALVRRLLAAQLPQWADLPVALVDSYGTDHDVYRLGEHLAARLPRVAWAAGQAATEARWLPRLAPHLPLRVPVPLARGLPGEGYPFEWSVVGWLPGSDANGTLADLDRAALDLAAFVTALRGVDTAGAPPRPPGRRGGPLGEVDAQVRRSVTELGDRVDAAAVLRLWDDALAAPAWGGAEVWVHGDLLPGNLIVDGGRLSAVIDWGALAVGDPAADLQPAWVVFSGASRQRFRGALGADDASWRRGRGWSLFQAVSALPSYRQTNPDMVAQATRVLGELLSDGP
jgi:aminoglycoside phosphotransferase (APT) family kinase protein